MVVKQQNATTTEQLRSATTDAEVQKLTAVFTGLSAALESTDQEVGQATASAVVQELATIVAAGKSTTSLIPHLGKDKSKVLTLNLRNRMIFRAADEGDAVQADDFLGKKRVAKRSWGHNAGKRNVNWNGALRISSTHPTKSSHRFGRKRCGKGATLPLHHHIPGARTGIRHHQDQASVGILEGHMGRAF